MAAVLNCMQNATCMDSPVQQGMSRGLVMTIGSHSLDSIDSGRYGEVIKQGGKIR